MPKVRVKKKSHASHKSAARLLAVQALYQILLTRQKYEDVLKEFVKFRIEKSKVDMELFETILSGVSKKIKNIDLLEKN